MRLPSDDLHYPGSFGLSSRSVDHFFNPIAFLSYLAIDGIHRVDSYLEQVRLDCYSFRREFPVEPLDRFVCKRLARPEDLRDFLYCHKCLVRSDHILSVFNCLGITYVLRFRHFGSRLPSACLAVRARMPPVVSPFFQT